MLRHQTLTMATTAATLVATVALYLVIPKGFLPSQDSSGDQRKLFKPSAGLSGLEARSAERPVRQGPKPAGGSLPSFVSPADGLKSFLDPPTQPSPARGEGPLRMGFSQP